MVPTGSLLRFDATGLVRAAGRVPALADLRARTREATTLTLARRASGELGFWELPDGIAEAQACTDFVAGLPAEIDTLVVLGIGGSSLGPRALVSALTPPWAMLRPGSRRVLCCDNVDAATFAGLLAVVDPRRTVWNVVTKSGATAETCAQLLIVLDWLAQRGLDPVKHVVITTDPARGAMRQLANRYRLPAFAVPPSVGGRFSVLSAVGLLPAAFAGVDVQALLAGARQMRDRVAQVSDVNPAAWLAGLLHHHDQLAGRPMVVMMPYADALYDTAEWFRQLWAESLGKARRQDGVATGPTPIAARGATDQHSQLQLFAEGPDDKSYLIVSALGHGPALPMPRHPWADDQPELSYLVGHDLRALMEAERRGTAASLRRRGRPVGLVDLEAVSPAALGAMVLWLEAATAFAGPLYDVEAFDQPGVEEAKRLAFAALGRPGYGDPRDVDAALTEEAAYVW